jgi:hypothetical protein
MMATNRLTPRPYQFDTAFWSDSISDHVTVVRSDEIRNRYLHLADEFSLPINEAPQQARAIFDSEISIEATAGRS